MSLITHRPYVLEQDTTSIEELILASRTVKTLERYPTIWRIRQLLASRVWEPERDAHVWEDASGRCIGFAYLWKRKQNSTKCSMDSIIHPHAHGVEIFAEMLTWASIRAQEVAFQLNTDVSLSLATFADEDVYIQALQYHNFSLLQDGYDLYMACSLDNHLPEPNFPTGYALQLLSGKENLAAYQALLGFTPVGMEHRLHQFESSEYQHLVVTAPDDTFVAYLECSIWQKEWQHSGCRCGWIDYIGTSDEHQHQGIGRALLTSGLAHLQSWGANTAMLITASFNVTAHRVFKAGGFQIAERDLCYARIFSPA